MNKSERIDGTNTTGEPLTKKTTHVLYVQQKQEQSQQQQQQQQQKIDDLISTNEGDQPWYSFRHQPFALLAAGAITHTYYHVSLGP